MDRVANLDHGRIARWVFVFGVGLAVPLLAWFGRDQWFFLDEWSPITSRPMPSLDSLFAPHNGHWITLPVIAYRVNYSLFGLNSYLPYQLPVILLHVGIGVLMWIFMRRFGVREWIATIAALVFIFFGSGYENIVFGFQVSLNGSLFLGLLAMLLADHVGPFDRRDFGALVALILALMTSGIAVPMVAAVTASVLIRRGWRSAAVYAVAPGSVFVLWYLTYGAEGSSDISGPSATAEFVGITIRETFEALGQNGAIAVLLAAVAVGGIAATQLMPPFNERRARALSAGLLVGLGVFVLLTAVSRSGAEFLVSQSAGSSRYLHVAAVFVIPFVGVAVEVLSRRSWIWGTLVLACLVAGVPGNIEALRHRDPWGKGSKDAVIALAASQFVDDAPADFQPLGSGLEYDFTVEWLRGAVKRGQIPQAPPGRQRADLWADGRLALQEQAGEVDMAGCLKIDDGKKITVQTGDFLAIEGGYSLVLREGEELSARLDFSPDAVIRVVAGRLSVAPDAGTTLCLVRPVA